MQFISSAAIARARSNSVVNGENIHDIIDEQKIVKDRIEEAVHNGFHITTIDFTLSESIHEELIGLGYGVSDLKNNDETIITW